MGWLRASNANIYHIGVWLLTLLSFRLQAQKDSLLATEIIQISATRQGQVLAADSRSNIFLFDSTGKLLYQFSPRKPARIYLLEGWNGLRPFAFYRDFQEYLILDRFLLSDAPIAVNSETIGYARLVAPAADGHLWVFDESGFQLKKVDANSQKVLFSTPLDLVLNARSYDITFMREFQNQLYICDKKGFTLQFDQMGNFKKRIPFQEAVWFGTIGEELYAVQQDSIIFYHPENLRVRKTGLPCRKPITQIIFRNRSIWRIEGDNLIWRKL